MATARMLAVALGVATPRKPRSALAYSVGVMLISSYDPLLHLQGTPLTTAELELVGAVWTSPPTPRRGITSARAASPHVPKLRIADPLSTGGASFVNTGSCAA